MTIYKLLYVGAVYQKVLQYDSTDTFSIGFDPTWSSQDFTSTSDLITEADILGLDLLKIKIDLGIANDDEYQNIPIDAIHHDDSEFDMTTRDGIKALRNYLLGLAYYNSHWFNFNADSKTTLLGLKVAKNIGALPGGWTTSWVLLDNTVITIGLSDIDGLYGTLLGYDQSVWAAYNADIALLLSSQPPVNLLAISRP